MSTTVKERPAQALDAKDAGTQQLEGLETKDGKCTYCGKPVSECLCEDKTEVFDVSNIDCASCALEMENRIAKLPRVKSASIVYSTKQLRVTCPHPDMMRLRFQEECCKVDDGVVVTPHVSEPAESKASKASASSESDEDEESVHVKQIVAGLAFFAAGEIAEHAFSAAPEWISIVLYLISYVIVGYQVIANAFKNIRRGQVFDEQFLMTVATFGAIGIQQWPEAVAVMLFYRIGEAAEDKAVDRSRSQVMDAIDMRPETVNRLVDYQVVSESKVGDTVEVDDARARSTENIPAEDAQIGDYVLVAPGERIPLDGVVVEGGSRVDTSPVTGEPVPVSVGAGDKVTSGCVNGQGMLVMRVEKPLSESMVTRILDTVENAAASKPQMERFITRFARVYTPIVLAIAVATAIVPSIVTGDWYHWIYVACTFLVISCPCAIVLSVPLSFFSGIGAAGKLGVLFKGGTVLEALSKVSAVVMDKTGTVTKGVFAVNEIRVAGEGAPGDVSNSGSSVDSSDSHDLPARAHDVLTLAASAESVSTHPIAQSVVAKAREERLSTRDPKCVEEIAGKGVVATIATQGTRIQGLGSNDTVQVACGNEGLMEYVGAHVPEQNSPQTGSVVHVAVNGLYAGSIYISDVPKPESKGANVRLHDLGVRTAMLTGDAEAPAKRIAAEVGIDEVRSELLPSQKLDAMKEIRAQRGSVAFVGDGINDAPVLAGADVGMAMGSGSDAAIEAADVVVMNSNMDSVPTAIALARAVQVNATENVVFAIGVKILVMVLGFVGIASMWAAVFADSGVALLCVLNSIRLLAKRFD